MLSAYLSSLKKEKHYLTDLAEIARISEEKEKENASFRDFLRTQDADDIDARVGQLNATITPEIDCTACGNCCKTLMINVTEREADNLAAHLHMPRETFDTKYLEKSDHSDRMVINAIPCHFLQDNKCTVYEHRFAGCREFPALHRPGFTKRLFTVFMHYNRCPIIFNVVEALKQELPTIPETAKGTPRA